MSRIGKKPIPIPSGVKVSYLAPMIEIGGKLGSLKRVVPSPLTVDVKGNEIMVHNPSSDSKVKALHGLTRTLVKNMVLGVTQGYVKELELQGVGYRAQTQGNKLSLSVGFSHPVDFLLPAGISATVDALTKITLRSADKELLGIVAMKLRRVRPPEPYKGKGIRFLGEVITLKQGKTAGGGAK